MAYGLTDAHFEELEDVAERHAAKLEKERQKRLKVQKKVKDIQKEMKVLKDQQRIAADYLKLGKHEEALRVLDAS